MVVWKGIIALCTLPIGNVQSLPLSLSSVGSTTNIDTKPFREATWYYIQSIKGIRHDDYNYGKVSYSLLPPSPSLLPSLPPSLPPSFLPSPSAFLSSPFVLLPPPPLYLSFLPGQQSIRNQLQDVHSNG